MIAEQSLREITYRHHEGYIYFAWFLLELLFAVDNVALDVVDGEVVEAVLVVVPNHATVVDAGLAAVGVAAVLAHAGAVVEAHRGGGEQRPLVAGDRDRDVELCLVVMCPGLPRHAHTSQLRPRLPRPHHQFPLFFLLCASANWKHCVLFIVFHIIVIFSSP